MTLLLLAAALAAEPTPPVVESTPALDARTAVAFGDHLLTSGDPYNALTYFRLALFLEPERPDAESLRFRIGLAYERGERWPAAVFAYGQVGGDLADRAAYRAALAEHRAGVAGAADLALERVTLFFPDSSWAPRAAYARGVLALQAGELQQAESLFAAFSFPDHALAPRARSLAEAAALPLPRRSPTLAASLSVVPGLGQLYAGHPGDALMAALFNIPLGVGSGLLLADGIETGRPVEIAAGAVLGSVFLVATYPSNLIGAWRGAVRTNEHRERRAAEALLEQAWEPSLELGAEDVRAP